MMSDPMDIDTDAQNGAGAPSATSPPPQASMPGAFEVPKVNGNVSGSASPNGDAPPAPPPHKSNPTSPVNVAPTPEEAEAFKLAGNKFYKNKEYRKAIDEYTKGMIIIAMRIYLYDF